jgi:hypothetical protein
MTAWLGAAFLVVAFLVLLRVLHLADLNRRVLEITSDSLGIMGNSSLGDDEKERRLRRHALGLFRLLFLLVAAGAAAVLLPLGMIWLLDRLGWLSAGAVVDTAVSPAFIVATVVAGAVIIIARPRQQPAAATRYSPAEQLIHRLAFSTVGIQKVAAVAEDRIWRRRLATAQVRRPVFITALPRAGTTLLLECCAGVPELASHTYRDMPFLLTPLAWNAGSRLFRARGQRRERAHGDGVFVDFDSPEAFEEMVWKAFWPEHYAEDRIVPWNEATSHPSFERFLDAHMRKIVVLRRRHAAGVRYVSKNNLNIARLQVLHALFPEASVVVPFRDPIQHALSLQRQHGRFLELQREDPFIVEYMRETGHYDFGETLRPVDFGRWLDADTDRDPRQVSFWIEYWLAAYDHLLDFAATIQLVDYDELCEHPARDLGRLGEAIGLEDPGALVAAAPDIRPQEARPWPTAAVSEDLLARATALHARLKATASSGPVGR